VTPSTPPDRETTLRNDTLVRQKKTKDAATPQRNFFRQDCVLDEAKFAFPTEINALKMVTGQ
jgi:hypothetical protein